MADVVVLRGGPFDGAEIDRDWAAGVPLLCQGEPLPEGMVARYRKSREKGVYTFRGYDRVIGMLPLPGREAVDG